MIGRGWEVDVIVGEKHRGRSHRLWWLIWVVILLIGMGWPRYAGAQSGTIHTVQPGENLFRIALRHGTTVDAIMGANDLANHTIRVGQELVIPDVEPMEDPESTAADITYVVEEGDTLSTIAWRYGLAMQMLIEENGLASTHQLYPGQQLKLPGVQATESEPEAEPESDVEPETEPAAEDASETPETYTVRAGDTLFSIARKFETDVSTLSALNGISNPAHIYVGQELRLSGDVPALASAPASVTSGGWGGGKRIVVDISEQHLYAYQGDQLVYSFVASTGQAPTYTKTGEFYVQSKIPNAYGSAWNIWMPHWLGIYWAGSTENGIHALPILPGGGTLWAGYLGTPVSYGCVVLGTYEASQLYQWAEIGTPVSIRY